MATKASVGKTGGRRPQPPSPPPATRPAHLCRGTTRDGRPCNAPHTKDSEFCRFHDPRPEVKAEVLKVKVAGGQARLAPAEWDPIEIKSKEDLRKFTNVVLNQVAGKKMNVKIAYALAPHLANMTKLIEEGQAEQANDVTDQVLMVIKDHPDVQEDLLKALRPELVQ